MSTTNNRPIPSSTTTKTPPRPQSSQPRPLFHVRPQNPNATTSYPLASTGRGYIPRPFPPPSLPPPFTRHHPTHYYAAPIKGVPVSAPLVKVTSSPSPVADSNGYKNTRDMSRDDFLLVTVRDRKVRISEGASLYALCRSWLKNGLPEENQHQYGDSVKSLPRPQPIPVLDTQSPKKKEAEGEVEVEKEVEGPVDQLSPKDILTRHVNRAKKVRARLRDERLKRIARHKTRLALLLPPHVEQCRNDTVAGN